jgi:hypothetical protein
MPSISDLNGGAIKLIPSATDKIPVQESGGNTVPITVAGLLACPAFIEAVQDIVGALIAGGTGVTVTYDDTANTLTITVP